jgi:predicted amidohydrolase
MLVTVTAIQHQTGQQLTLEQKLHIFKQRPDFICLPEYCLIQESDPDFSRAAMCIKENLEYLRNLSIEFSTCLIAGSVVEGGDNSLYNSSYIFNRGSLVGRYRKMSPVDGELGQGILPGDKIFTATIDDVKIAVLICADALNAKLFDLLFDKKADIIFIPTTSPYRPAESKSEKFKRDNDIFLTGSQRAGAHIVKTSGVGTLFRKPLQGRSLIVSPWGFIKRVPIYAEREASIMTATLDIDEIREFHSKKEIRDLSNANK